ncbi:hypothetical protein BJ508DRAFT_63348 [Ascobolus immersus RN42]|uniref:Ankyrin n=1 Tax=Ascobolus immersus RN42 TaxID=1160509 RepID=A0A3N4ITY6_ASCIM|nr:hypothetical protein BJ508DRAFT_63348 [Ascobolus immersus RN42]
MNVDVLADNPPIWTYFAFAVGTFVLVMATVYLWKRRELCENFLIGSFLRNSNYRKLVVDDEELQLNSTPTPTRDTFEMAKQALYSSIEAGNEATFRTIIRKNKSLVNEPLGCSNSSLVRNADLQYGPSPLMLAAYYGRINIVRCLIELGANIDAVDRIERTANSYALFSRRLDVSILRVLNRKSSTSSGLSQYAPLLPMFLQMCQWDQDSSAKSTPEDVITFILSHPCFKGRITYQACKELDEHKSKVYCSLIDAFKSCYSLEIAASLLRIVALLATSKTHRYFESSISDGVRDKDLDIIRSFGINLCQSPVCEDLLQSMGCLDQDSSLKWYKELEALWDDILGKLGQRMKEHCQWKHIVLDGALRRLNKRVLHSGDPLECPTEDPLTPTGALDLVQTTMHVWNVGLSCYDEVFDAPRYSMPLIFALLEDFYDAPSYRGFNEWWAAAGSERTEAALALFDLFLDIGGTRSLELRLEMRSDSQRPRPWHSQYESGKTGKTPLIYAACHGLHQHALILLERGADINRGLSLQERLGLRWTGPARGRLMLLRIWRTYWLEGIVGHRR